MKRRRRKNYWDQLIDDSSISREELFFRIKDLYISLLRHTYNDPKDIPDVKIPSVFYTA